MKRLTRKQIEQGLETIPMQTLLMGVSTSKEKRLTPKQLKFAEELAMGKSKAEAYRKSHNSKGKPKTQMSVGAALFAVFYESSLEP